MENVYEKRTKTCYVRIFNNRFFKEFMLGVDTKKKIGELERALLEKNGFKRNKEKMVIEHKFNHKGKDFLFEILLMDLEGRPLADPEKPVQIQATASHKTLGTDDNAKGKEIMLRYFKRFILPVLD